MDALVHLADGVGTPQLADNLEGELHRAAGGEARDEFAVDHDPARALNLPGGKLRLHGGMADDLLFRLQPAVGQQRGGRGEKESVPSEISAK